MRRLLSFGIAIKCRKSLAIGQCDNARAGPGVTCMAAVKIGRPIDRIVGFAKSASGERIATIN